MKNKIIGVFLFAPLLIPLHFASAESSSICPSGYEHTSSPGPSVIVCTPIPPLPPPAPPVPIVTTCPSGDITQNSSVPGTVVCLAPPPPLGAQVMPLLEPSVLSPTEIIPLSPDVPFVTSPVVTTTPTVIPVQVPVPQPETKMIVPTTKPAPIMKKAPIITKVNVPVPAVVPTPVVIQNPVNLSSSPLISQTTTQPRKSLWQKIKGWFGL